MVRRSTLVLVVCLAALVTLSACRGRRIETSGTSVASGDMLYGRLPAERAEQSFSFEGVQSAMLDFTLQADEGSKAAPDITLTDPDGDPVDLSAATMTAKGAATTKVQDVVLLRNGLYRLTATPPMTCQNTFYRFSHCLRFPAPAPKKVRLSACTEQAIYVSAPRGGLIAFEMRPLSGGVVPKVKAVEDPWGGRALDKNVVPPGANPPRLSHGHLGESVLTFTAARPGKYKIVTTAAPGTDGVARLSVQVRTPRGSNRVINHPNTLPHYGLPGTRANMAPTVTPAPTATPTPTRAPARPAPPPMTPSAPASSVSYPAPPPPPGVMESIQSPGFPPATAPIPAPPADPIAQR